ncbi:hypothetical protein D4Z93_06870 [Clostridium fermenticellae]|uniref:Right-handed parallel beta-helix repeat-containing protein n=1 Tax=Clostridium fermenticellae TaxID=2068654 RepID=A0A386H443_9CLOT|nr:hypothetical protein [Clostridium fermenticellae]AYD40255.1 hypothetical protein D4Z93_06870 [Clostridium fermenticellae]
MTGIDNNSFNKIRQYFKNHKAAAYPIKGHPLEESENYIKSVYMEMLCVILQYGGLPKGEQILFVRRLLEGIGFGDRFDECMRKALCADEAFACEFVKQFKHNDLKYNFIVDSLITIASVGTPEKYSVEFVSEICEALLLNKKEVQFLVNVALSILEQNSEIYSCILDKNLAQDMIGYFMCYFKQFFVGKLVDTNAELYYFAKEMAELKLPDENIENCAEFKQDNIVFENYIIDLSKISFKFVRCDYVEFINCSFSGIGPIVFENCKHVNIIRCSFNDFTKGVFDIKSCYSVNILKSNFKNCGKVGSSDIYGGIIYSDNLNEITIKMSKFNGCFVKSGNGYDRIYGIIFCGSDSTKHIVIENNDFGYFDVKNITDSDRLFYGVNKEHFEIKDNTMFDNNMRLV